MTLIYLENFLSTLEITENFVVKLNVYKLKDSSLGFYHTGVEFRNLEYTFCCGIGICYHKPRHCHFAILLGTIQLGFIEFDFENFQSVLKGILTRPLRLAHLHFLCSKMGFFKKSVLRRVPVECFHFPQK